ncbi:MAG: hypothetical protein ABW168_14085 [Sedimenticola sp.]
MTELSLGSVYDAMTSGIASPTGRPIAQLSFALNHYFSGFDPFAFKATNLAIHLATGLLIYFAALRLLASGIFAGFAALLWLVHPIQLTSVLYVVQRMTSLSTLFLLAGFLLHMSGRERGGRNRTAILLLAWLVCWPLSIMSKEIGVLFPLLILAWEVIIRRSVTVRLDRFARILTTAISVAFATALIYVVLTNTQWLLDGYTTRGFSLTERLLTEGRVLWLYFGLIVFPRLESLALHHDDILLSTSFLSPWTTLPSLLGLVGLVWLAWQARKKAPLMSFGIAWFLIGHSLESTLLPLEIAHEHRNYLPSFGLAIIAAWALARAVEHSGWQKTLSITLAVGMMSSFAITTSLRTHQFGDELRRTQIEAQHHPNSKRTHYEAGKALVSHLAIPNAGSPRYYFARKHYERAGELDPTFKPGLLGLIHLNCLVKKAPEKAWFDELSRHLHETTFSTKDRNLLYHIKEMSIVGTLCMSRNEVQHLFTAAITNTTTAHHIKAILHSWQADYLILAAHDLPAAQSELNKSLAIAPNNASNLLKWSQLAFLQGHNKDAHEVLNRLKGMTLIQSERYIFKSLSNCLDTSRATQCTLKSGSRKQEQD